MRHLTKLIFTTFLTFFSILQLNATHMVGAEITYKSLGSGKFLITGKLYRDCRGIGIGGTNGFKIFCADKNIGTYTLPMKRKAINNITPSSSKAKPACSPQNRVSGKGIEEHIFETTIDFNKLPYKNFVTKKGCEIIISFRECCRNSAMTTGINGALFTYAMINICNFDIKKEKQSTPKFYSKPIIFTCCNQNYRYNLGAIDTSDYDSLSFEMDDPLSDWKKKKSYNSPLSKNMPITPYCPSGLTNCSNPRPNLKRPQGFSLNKKNGEIVFNPIKCNEVSVFVIKVTEWRKKNGKMKIVGISRRDVHIWVDQCPNNNPPQISAKYDHTVYIHDSISIVIKAKDLPYKPTQKKGDTVSLTWSKSINGATFTVKADTNGRDQIGTFKWKPQKSDLQKRPYTFTVLAQDDNFPLRAQEIKFFSIIVKESIVKANVSQLSCGIVKLKSEINKARKGASYLWVVKDSNMKILDSSKLSLDTLSIGYIGKINVDLIYNDSIQNKPQTISNSIILTPKVSARVLDHLKICKGSIINVKPDLSFLTLPLQYKWTVNNKYHSKIDSLFYTSNNDSIYSISIVDNIGCKLQDTAKISYKKSTIVEMNNTLGLCENTTVSYGPIYNPQHTYFWLNDSSTSSNILITKAGLYIVKVTDGITKCSTLDSVIVKMKKQPVFNLAKSARTCPGKSVKIGVPNNTDYLYSWYPTNKKTSQIIVSLPRRYTLNVIDKITNCRLSKSINFSNFPKPVIDMGNNKGKCFGDSITIGSKFYKQYTYKWKDNKSTANYRRIVKPKTYHLTVTDSNKCTNSDSVTIRERKRVNVDIGNDTAFCFGSSIKLEVDYNAENKYLWEPTLDNTHTTLARKAGVYYVTVTNYLNCKGRDTVTVKINDEIKITRPTQQNIKLGESVKLTASATPKLTSNKYEWENLKTNKVTKGNTITVSPKSSQSYKFTATVKQNNLVCSESSQTYVKVGTSSSLQSYLLSNKLNVFPNPVKSDEPIIIKLDDINNQKTLINIYDINGKRIPLKISRHKNIFTIQPIYRKGEFIIEIDNNGLKAYRKIIVNN